MDEIVDRLIAAVGAASEPLHLVWDYVPHLGMAGILLLAGWLTARALRSFLLGLLRLISKGETGSGVLAGWGARASLGPATAEFLGNLIFWTVLGLSAVAALSVLDLPVLDRTLDRLVTVLPRVAGGVLAVCAALVLGNVAYHVVATAARRMPGGQRAFLARGAQGVTLGSLVLVGMDLLGVNTAAVVSLASVVAAALLGGLALAFGLGARTLVSNLIGARYLSDDYQVGERIHVGIYTGVVLEISAVAVVLDTDRGRVSIPAKVFSERPSILLGSEDGHA